MLGFTYTYKTPEEILNNIVLIQEYGIIEWVALVIFLLIVAISIFYIVPLSLSIKEKHDTMKIKRKKSSIIKQIAFQRNIDDEIEQEIKNAGL